MRFISSVLILMAGLVAVNLALSVPFYYSWDMDLTTVLDILRIQDNQIPTHLNHPGLGFYWILFWAHEVATWTGFITPSGIASLQHSFEPLLIIAEHSDYLRAINAIFCVALAVALWTCLTSYLESPKGQSLLLLVLCLLTPGIWRYDILLIRTETYSVFFWILSLHFTVRAARASGGAELKKYAWVSGFFAALSFFTKIQSFFLVVMLPVLFLIFREKKSLENPADFGLIKPLRFKWVFWSFFILCGLAVAYQTPSAIAAFEDKYLPNKFFFVFLISLFVLSALVNQSYPLNIKLGRATFQRVSEWIAFRARKYDLVFPRMAFIQFAREFAVATPLIFLLCATMLLGPLSTLKYALLDFKMIFMRWTFYGSLGQLNPFKNLFFVLVANWGYFLGFFAILFLMYKQSKRQRDPYLRLLVFLTIGVLLVHFCLGVRGGTQDGIWVEVPILGLGILFLGRFGGLKRYLNLVISFLILVSIVHIERFNAPGNNVGYFDSHMYFDEVYKFGTYAPVLQERYPTRRSRDEAIKFALRWREWKNILINNLPESGASLHDVTNYEDQILVSLRGNTSDTLVLQFRPDQLQTIFFEKMDSSNIKNCKKGPVHKMDWNGKEYEGYEVQSLLGGGVYVSSCEISDKNLKTAFVLINQKAVSSFRNLNLSSEPYN